MKSVVGLYDRLDDARQAIHDLRDAGFRGEDISIIARDEDGNYSRHLGDRPAEANDISEGAGAGAGIGAILGGLGGLLVGLGALAIPGIGPVLAAGPLVTALAGAGVGALAGGIVGALVELGVPDDHADYYAEGIRRGGTLLVVRADDLMAERAMTIMNRYQPVNMDDRVEMWRQGGWQKFDTNHEAMTSSDMSSSVPVTGESTFGTDSQHLDRDDMEYDVLDHHDTHSTPVTGESTFGTDSQHLDRDDMERGRPYQHDQSSVPVTGSTVEPVVPDREMYSDRERTYENVDMLGRSHYQAFYGSQGRDYSFYQPAYRFGYDLIQDPGYRDYDWDRMEPVAREAWGRRGQESAWEEIKDAVRHAWYEMRH